MPTLVPGWTNRPVRPNIKRHGFTLLELLVVLVIVGMTLGAVVLNVNPGQRQLLYNEAQRIAQLMQLARDEAIVRNQAIAFETDSTRYRFLIREANEWRPLLGDELLRERSYRIAPLSLRLDPVITNSQGPLRIVFGREPVDKPFSLSLTTDVHRVVVRADGIGHFEVD
jgi:general secretion pathway protein H